MQFRNQVAARLSCEEEETEEEDAILDSDLHQKLPSFGSPISGRSRRSEEDELDDRNQDVDEDQQPLSSDDDDEDSFFSGKDSTTKVLRPKFDYVFLFPVTTL